ncbi:MAG TPA: hypothetical protein VK157_08540 [Phycisphaerales bacterium]|nr:hypothetical protein [Phycisphaerales bacterium]
MTRRQIGAIVVAVGCASVAMAQEAYPAGTVLRFQVWTGSQWANELQASTGDRVEYRATVSYTGANTETFALADMRYQPTFSNTINSGVSVDTNAPFRNGGTSGSGIAGSMLTASEGASGSQLASYGRVTYGGFAANSQTQTVLTQFRHGGGFAGNGAPAGSWIRLAGDFVTNWPSPTIPAGTATATSINTVLRGVSATQLSRINPLTGSINTNFVAGTQDMVVFRGALLLANNDDVRTIVISNAEGSLLRAGGLNGADDRRYVSWFTNDAGATVRTSVAIESASIFVNVPTPGAVSVVGVAGLLAVRRRR